MRRHLDTQNVAKVFGFLASRTDLLKGKDFISHIFTGRPLELSNRKIKSAKGVDPPETASPEVLSWTVNGERKRCSLVTRPLAVCGHAYSETNVDLKLPNEQSIRSYYMINYRIKNL